MKYDITPMGAVRMNKSDAWRKRPAVLRYMAFKNHFKLLNVKLDNGNSVIFHIPMPQSWSKKKRKEMEWQPHTQKPDIDNLLKAVMDALFQDDAHIHNLHIRKVWAVNGAIEIV